MDSVVRKDHSIFGNATNILRVGVMNLEVATSY